MREKIREHIVATLVGVEVDLEMRPCSPSAKGHPFVSIPDDVLREMD